MNRDNVQLTYDTLSKLAPAGMEERFNMERYFSTSTGYLYDHPEVLTPDPEACGTAACLAGWACMIMIPGVEPRYPGMAAAQWYGLAHKEADHWFLGRWATTRDSPERPTYRMELAHITLSMALTFLRHVLDTDETMAVIEFNLLEE